MSLLIKNAHIFDGFNEYYGDIYCEEGLIKKIGQDLVVDASEMIDLEGAYLFPGGIDVHTHLDLDLVEFRSIDDWYQGTVAAAYGGNTTIVDHIAFGPRGCSLQSMVDTYHELAKDKAVIDYSFHGVIQDVNESCLLELNTLKEEGIPSLKLYTTYGGMLEDKEILEVLKEAKKTDTVVCVHCENDGAIALLREEYGKEGKLSPIYHAKSRPNVTEAEAVNRLIYLSELAGYPKLYIVHTSTEEALEEIKIARKRGVPNLYCETCPQYLLLTEDKYTEKGDLEGLKYIMAPPLRQEKDLESLWQGIIQDEVDVIATDHCPFYYESKLLGKDDFRKTPGGAPGIEERMEVILTEGTKRGLSINHLLQKLVVNPGKIFGLYPKKANISIGADADFAIYKKEDYVISQDNRHSNCDYTSYEGYTSEFRLVALIQRGKILIEEGDLKAEAGEGQFIARKTIKEA